MKVYIDSLGYGNFQKANLDDSPGLYFIRDSWNDYGYFTTYSVHLVKRSVKEEIGYVKFGYAHLGPDDISVTISQEKLDNGLDKDYFSLGTLSYYRILRREFPQDERNKLFITLNDMAFNPDILKNNLHHKVVQTSLLRSTSESDVYKQFHSIAIGGEYTLARWLEIFQMCDETDKRKLYHKFSVDSDSILPKNIHAIIGRNGAGKTHCLSQIYCALSHDTTRFTDSTFSCHASDNYLSKVLFISFGSLDSKLESVNGTKIKSEYLYIDNTESISEKFIEAMQSVFRLNSSRIPILQKAFQFIPSDSIEQAENIITKVKDLVHEDSILEIYLNDLHQVFMDSSPGNKILFYSIARLTELLSEGMLLLVDEPENHMHPEILSGLIQAYSYILNQENGMGIIATHSPLVLQEIPQSNVLKMSRQNQVSVWKKPEIETYGASISTLYREAFGVDSGTVGYIRLLKEYLNNNLGTESDEIRAKFQGKLGELAESYLEILLFEREKKKNEIHKSD